MVGRSKDSISNEANIRHAISLRPSPFNHANTSQTTQHRDPLRRSETLPAGANPLTSDDVNEAPNVAASSSIPAQAANSATFVTSPTSPYIPMNAADTGHSSALEGAFSAADNGMDTIERRATTTASAPLSTFTSRGKGITGANNSIHSIHADGDVEKGLHRGKGKFEKYNDPYQLSSHLQTNEEIEKIRANSSRKLLWLGRRRKNSKPTLLTDLPTTTNPKNNNPATNTTTNNQHTPPSTAGSTPSKHRSIRHSHRIANHYEAQIAIVERLLKPVDDHRQEAKDTVADNQLRYKIAVHGSFVANLLLAVLQVYAAASSGSLALFTTMADALFDPLSNLSLILSHRAINRVDGRRFPVGKARIETAANIAFCYIMTAVSLVIIVLSIREIAQGSTTRTTKVHLPSVIVIGVAFMVKFALFCYCWAIRDLFSQVHILWEDHRNDLIINGTGLGFSLMGSYVRWFIDPLGAVVISFLIIFLWQRTAYSENLLLIGETADRDMLAHITYIAMTHSDQVLAIDTVRAYYSGPRLIVEVDIVMDAEETLKATHDLAEDLQIKLESLPNVERAFVHVDYETSHAPEHFLKKEL